MKVFPFKIPKAQNEALIYQEDRERFFYDKLHQHIEIQISLIVNGEGTLIVGDTVNQYKTNDIIVIGSNIPHVFKSDATENEMSEMISLFFSQDSFGEDFFKLNEFETLQNFFNLSEYGFKINSKREEITRLFLRLKETSKLKRFILFLEILELLNNSETEVLSSFINKKSYSDNEGKRMGDVFEYTMNKFAEHISLKEIADVASMTTNAFCRYFKQRTNKTYIQFLTEIRIDNASRLLRKNQDLSITEIAHKSGFSNISNFNRKFKQLKKTTPLKYKSK